MNTAFLSLGSNLNFPLKNLTQAIKLIQKQPIKITAYSAVYQTKAWGNTQQDDFLNAVIEVKTDYNAPCLLHELLRIEEQMGRVRNGQTWMPRIIDIDILYFNDSILHTVDLVIPHPYIAQRKFTLVPLNDVAPDYLHPILQVQNKQLLELCSDQGKVIKTTYHINSVIADLDE